jgi:hypothetical protein
MEAWVHGQGLREGAARVACPNACYSGGPQTGPAAAKALKAPPMLLVW